MQLSAAIQPRCGRSSMPEKTSQRRPVPNCTHQALRVLRVLRLAPPPAHPRAACATPQPSPPGCALGAPCAAGVSVQCRSRGSTTEDNAAARRAAAASWPGGGGPWCPRRAQHTARSGGAARGAGRRHPKTAHWHCGGARHLLCAPPGARARARRGAPARWTDRARRRAGRAAERGGAAVGTYVLRRPACPGAGPRLGVADCGANQRCVAGPAAAEARRARQRGAGACRSRQATTESIAGRRRQGRRAFAPRTRCGAANVHRPRGFLLWRSE